MKRIALILAIATFISCKGSTGTDGEETEPPVPTFKEENLIPLEVGNYWVYEGISDEPDTSFIAKDTTINGKKFYKQTNPVKYYAYSDSGLVAYSYNLSNYTIYRFEKPSDDLFTSFYKQNGMHSDRFDWRTSLIATDSTITTESGTYQCSVYHSYQFDTRNNDEITFQERMFFSEDIGLVRRSIQHIYFDAEEVISYHIGDNPEEL